MGDNGKLSEVTIIKKMNITWNWKDRANRKEDLKKRKEKNNNIIVVKARI